VRSMPLIDGVRGDEKGLRDVDRYAKDFWVATVKLDGAGLASMVLRSLTVLEMAGDRDWSG